MPQIKIISPVGGQTIFGDKVTVSFIAADFTVGQDGHLNLWLDNPVEEASTAAKILGQFNYTLSDLVSGPHKLTLEVVTRDNLSFRPPIKQTVYFTTSSPQIPTITSFPTPSNIVSFVGLINWQYVLLITALIIITVGLILKSTFGKPKMWK